MALTIEQQGPCAEYQADARAAMFFIGYHGEQQMPCKCVVIGSPGLPQRTITSEPIRSRGIRLFNQNKALRFS